MTTILPTNNEAFIYKHLQKLSQTDVDKMVERHQHFLQQDCKGWETMRADFSNCEFIRISIQDCDLSQALFAKSNFITTYFKNVNLTEVEFTGATFVYTDLKQCQCQHATFHYARLIRTRFISSQLTQTSFQNANCVYAYFMNCKMTQLHTNEYTVGLLSICPEKGSFTAFKRVDNYLIELRIPAKAARSSATTRKCRCEFAKVVAITDLTDTKNIVKSVINKNYQPTVYTVGQMVYPDSWDPNRWEECAHGIHFFMTKEEAIQYGNY